MIRTTRIFVAGLLLAGAIVAAQEVQRHGLVFEEWVRSTFFGGDQPAAYTQPWDISAVANREHGGVPVNPKAKPKIARSFMASLYHRPILGETR